MIIDTYIEKFHIVNMSVKNIKQIRHKLLKQLNEENNKPPETIKRHWFIRFFSLLVALISVFLLYMAYTFYIHATQSQKDDFSIFHIILIILVLYYALKFFFTNTKKQKEKLTQEKIEAKLKRKLPRIIIDMYPGFYPKELGHAIYETRNEVTGNKKETFLGHAYILFPKENTDNQNSLLLINSDEHYVAQKDFKLSDITTCKIHEIEHDSKDYSIDTSKLELAQKFAADARINKRVSRITGSGQFINSIISHQSMREESNARHNLIEEKRRVEQKRKDEVIILLLQFSDGSAFFINHTVFSNIEKLHQEIEDN